MPILLDDIMSITNKAPRPNNAHFFSTYLTGRGTTTGLLNQSHKPGRYPLGQNRGNMSTRVLDTKSRTANSSVTVRNIPFAPLTTVSTDTATRQGMLMSIPNSVESFHITGNATTLDFDAYLDLTPQGTTLTEDGSGDAISRHLDVLYRMEIFIVAVGSKSTQVPMSQFAKPAKTGFKSGTIRTLDEFVMTRMSYAPLDDALDFIREATEKYAPTPSGVHVDDDDLATWMDDYDLYDRICRQADVWASTGISDVLHDYITALFSPITPQPSADELKYLAEQLRYLESYNVPLDAYRAIYNTVRSVCPPDIADTLSKQNLNLLMNGTLADLEILKPQLAVPPTTPAAMAALPKMFSAQQRDAITTNEPLSLTTAGAGTGKSTTILARIDYLTACGIDPKNITVLSFTNAAADHILEKNPAVGSMTIARMVLDIYKTNYPMHQISTVDTIVNALDIFYPNNDMARVLRKLLINVDKNSEGATTALNAFVEQHFDAVISALDTIQQTCLELQIIIGYQRIDTMIEPPHLAGKFLIVDEVQDNSIFEFIYLLRYVNKHRQNMFIVGDASQTLYEFRSANPKAINALEGSGVFATYKLTTNYRSNQEILDFANVHLADIEANALSQIRLQANSLAQPTAKSFQERVTLDYHTYPSQRAFTEDLPAILDNKVGPYIDACLTRGEDVAFLAFRKIEVAIIMNKLTELYPNENVADITSKRRRPMTVYSQYVKTYWNDVLQVRPADAAFVISRGIIDNLENLMGRNAVKMAPIVAKSVSFWWTSQAATINGWVALHTAGTLSTGDFFMQLMRNLLDYEIDQNGMKQNILNQQNRDRKEQNATNKARLTVSTIHGAKGLEFDNVVVLHQYDTAIAEDRKRMFYVAFTRAMKSEYILSFGKQKKPAIESDYRLIAQALEKRELLEQLRQQGIDIDAMNEDDLDNAMKTLAAAQTDEASDMDLVTV